jgi:hypothetical protein
MANAQRVHEQIVKLLEPLRLAPDSPEWHSAYRATLAEVSSFPSNFADKPNPFAKKDKGDGGDDADDSDESDDGDDSGDGKKAFPGAAKPFGKK